LPNSVYHIERHLTMLDRSQRRRLRNLIIRHILTNYSPGIERYIDTVVIDGMQFEFHARVILSGRLINVSTVFQINE